jgi:transcriptional antiterminator NusG
VAKQKNKENKKTAKKEAKRQEVAAAKAAANAKAEKEQEKAAKKTATSGHNNHIVISESEDKRSLWYVVHTYSGHENKVATALKQRVESMDLVAQINEILIPTQNKIRIQQGKKTEHAEKIFPGYILVKMILTDQSWLTVRTTSGVTTFIGIGSKPTPISEKEVAAIQKFMKQDAPKYQATFSEGEAVKIIEGPFTDFLGNIESIDEEKGKVKVLVSIFGRETPVELDFLQVSKI